MIGFYGMTPQPWRTSHGGQGVSDTAQRLRLFKERSALTVLAVGPII